MTTTPTWFASEWYKWATKQVHKISQSDLCNIVREVLQTLPNAGETFVQGALRQRNIHVQRWRVRNTIQLVDPLSRAMRRSVAYYAVFTICHVQMHYG